MDTETRISNLNAMLEYLDRPSFTIRYDANYKEIVLVYSREDSIMRKTTTEWHHDNKVKSRHTKEKALGGTNGRDMYAEIKKAVLEKAKKKVMKTAIERELAEYGIDARTI